MVDENQKGMIPRRTAAWREFSRQERVDSHLHTNGLSSFDPRTSNLLEIIFLGHRFADYYSLTEIIVIVIPTLRLLTAG